MGNGQTVGNRLGLRIGKAAEVEGRPGLLVKMGFEGGQLGWLVRGNLLCEEIASDRLEQGRNDTHPERNGAGTLVKDVGGVLE